MSAPACEFVLVCVSICAFVCRCVPECCGTHNAVEAVEGGVEVGLPAQAVHLYKHLRQEYPQEDEFSKIYTEGRQEEEEKLKRETRHSIPAPFNLYL